MAEKPGKKELDPTTAEPKLSKVTITLFWLALFGVWLVLLVTKHWGLGLTPESMVYVQAAKNLVSGQGLSVFYGNGGTVQPLTQFPPIFPFILSWGWFLGMDAFAWARFLNAALFGVNIFLAGMLAFNYSRKLSSAVLASVLLLASVHIFESHVRLLSTPLFLAEALGFFLAFSLFQKSHTQRSFYAALLLAAAAGLTQDIGSILILSGTLAFLMLPNGELRGRVRRAVFFAVFSFFPMVLWFVWKLINRDPSAGSACRFHWPTLESVYGSIDTVSIWLLPAKAPDVVRWAVLGLVIGVVLALAHRNRAVVRPPSSKVVPAPVWFLGTFFLAVVVTGFSVGGAAAFLHRSLVLVYAVLFVLLAANWHSLWADVNLSMIEKRVIFVCIIFFMALTAFRSVHFGAVFYKNGVGYNSKAWAESQVVRNLRALDDVPVYTNDPMAVYYLTGRPALKLPGSGQRSGHFPAADKVSDDFNRSRAVAVFFQDADEPKTSLAQAVPAVRLARFMGDRVAEIYGVKKNAR